MQMTSLDPFDLPLPPVVTLAVLVLGYVQSRIIRRGKPLSSIQRKLLFYGPVFTLGMTYAMAFHGQLAALFHWENAWIAVMVAWGRCWRPSLGRDIGIRDNNRFLRKNRKAHGHRARCALKPACRRILLMASRQVEGRPKNGGRQRKTRPV